MTLPSEARELTPRQIVEQYLAWGFRVVFWPQIDDDKGPRQKEWQLKVNTIDDYREGNRAGLMSGVEIAPNEFLTDIDLDWAEGSRIALHFLPPTEFVYGRAGKRISHCFYVTSEALPSFRYEDIDKTCLIELRGTKLDGTLGMQSMAPPSIWSKKGKIEPLEFVKFGRPGHIPPAVAQRQVCLSAIAMILARHLGKHGFGHDARLCWAGFLLRAGLTIAELEVMGRAISEYCDNREINDVRDVLDSTARNLNAQDAKIVRKVKGGPSLAKLIGDRGKAVIKRINGWLGHDTDFILNAEGAIVRDSQENIKRAVALCDITLSYDEFGERKLISEGHAAAHRLEDVQIEELWLRIDREFRFRPTLSFFHVVVNSLARENSFHPVREYLDALKWDGVPRINTWLAVYGGAVDDTTRDADESLSYLEAVSSIVLMAGVKRIYEPGCKYDEMPVLESSQGMNKSSALRALCPNGAWFSDDLALNIESKELIECTLGKWIIEASDLSGKKKSEIEKLKATLSRQIDGPARMAYARNPVERPRHFIIIGTTNLYVYLDDPTGARRFWPVKVKKFDVAGITRDRDQLWAEAVVRVKRGESIRMPEALWDVAGAQQEARREIDPWEEPVRQALLTIPPGGDEKRRVHASWLFATLSLLPAQRDLQASRRLSHVMQRFKFKRTNVRVDGVVATGYLSQEKGDPSLALDHCEDDAESADATHAAVGDASTRVTSHDDDVPF